MNSNTINNINKRVLGAKNASNSDMAPQQSNTSKTDKENVAADDLRSFPKGKTPLLGKNQSNPTSMKHEKSTFRQYEDQRDVRLGKNANLEAGPSQPKSRKRKALVDEHVDTPVAKRSRFVGSSLVLETPSKSEENPGSTIYPAGDNYQRIFKTFSPKPCVTHANNDEPVKPVSSEGNGTKQTYNSNLPETRDGCNDAPAATATKSSNVSEPCTDRHIVTEIEAGDASSLVGQDLLRVSGSSFAFDTVGEDLGEYRISAYSFAPFLGADFSPFAQASLGSEVQLELENMPAGCSISSDIHEEEQPSAAPAEISPGMFLAPGAEEQEGSATSEAEEQEESEASEAEEQEESAAPAAEVEEKSSAPVADAETQPAVTLAGASCATTSQLTEQAGSTSQQPASEAPTSGLLARVRGVPPAYVNTQSVDVATLLSREVTTAVTFTQEEKTTFLGHVRNGDDMAAMGMLPEEQRFSVLDTPESIAAYRAVRPPSASLENVEDRLWVCRAVVKVKLGDDKTIIGIEQMRKHCKNAVGSKDSVARHWRRTHLKLGDVKKANAASSASGSN
ncbi:hypothetical protein M408DRAFT_23101 [Serendipita vermifera MAFF 305830]|uniref:Uncharacterized protein n=1 Tax=Serendipita vermifera MAFF 305830 TaxID=933852 RepID=A0A0C2XJU0_SERVB|nr:hypothetical protein M408DRAFT_23101 [Serendipita vermifera MAFF 305830]